MGKADAAVSHFGRKLKCQCSSAAKATENVKHLNVNSEDRGNLMKVERMAECSSFRHQRGAVIVVALFFVALIVGMAYYMMSRLERIPIVPVFWACAQRKLNLCARLHHVGV